MLLRFVVAVLAVAAGELHAQTDFYNTSTRRPIRIEDAVPIEYGGVELNVAPVRVDFLKGDTRYWTLQPEATIGILPRTHVQVTMPIGYVDHPTTSARGVAGVGLSLLHAFNMETSVPALAIAADVSLPVGPLGGESTYGTLKGIVTRTFPWARLHANAEFTAGPSMNRADPGTSELNDGRDVSRWLAGVAIDKTFAFHSLLITAESFAERPIRDDSDIAWSAGTGLRYQLSPRWAMDAGIGRRFSGDDRSWYMTFGTAYALGIR